VFIQVTGSGLPECDGLYKPSEEPAKVSESGTKSTLGFWNGRAAWDRCDGKSERSPAISYSNSYDSWRIARLDGHLAYTIVRKAAMMPPTNVAWDVYKKGKAPAPTITIHERDPRLKKADKTVVFVLGGPGSGKGTTCGVVQEQLGFVHLSAGDLLRAERNDAASPHGALINKYIKEGKIVPVEITVALIKAAMLASDARNFLIDGFPRNLDNLRGWEKVMATASVRVAFCFFFECPLAQLEQRILKRAKFSGRSDDNIESLRKRFAVYKQETMPIVNVFRKRGVCVEVDTSRKRAAVYADCKAHLIRLTTIAPALQSAPLTDRSQCLLGLRAWPAKLQTEQKTE
jgi:UMP-CMP kinase family protein